MFYIDSAPSHPIIGYNTHLPSVQQGPVLVNASGPVAVPIAAPVARPSPWHELQPDTGLTRSSSEGTTVPPPSPSPTPSPPSSPHHQAFPIPDTLFDDLAFFAETMHLQELANPERIYLEQWQTEYPQLNPRTTFDIPGDPISQRFTILADAARPGHHNGQYVGPVVQNVQGYFERAMRPLIQEIEECQELIGYDEASIAEVDDLMSALEDGTL
jgi:hypothetical protein